MHAIVFVLNQAAVEYGAMNARGVFAQLRRQVSEFDPLFLILLGAAILGFVWIIRKV